MGRNVEQLARVERERYLYRTPQSADAYERAGVSVESAVSRGTMVYPPYPFYAARGDGAYLHDLDGNRYLDLINNYTSLIHGHGHKPTEEAAKRALSVSQAPGAPTVDEARMADELRKRLPAMETVRLTTTGSEALQYAIRVARAATGKKRILKFEGAFHGSEAGLVQDLWNTSPMAPGTARPATPNSRGLDQVSTITAVYNDPLSVAAAFSEWGEEIAVVVLEPFLGNNSLITAKKEFLTAVFERAQGAGALVLLDEIQGLRASYGGTQQIFGVTPDLTTVGKILSGGFALAAFGGRRELMEHLSDASDPMPQSGTFTASSIALKAGLAALGSYGPEEYSRLNTLKEAFAQRSIEEFAQVGLVAQVNGLGSMFHVSLNDHPVDTFAKHLNSDHELWAAVRLGLLNRGVNLMLRGTGCLSTPMVQEDVDRYGQALRDVLSTL